MIDPAAIRQDILASSIAITKAAQSPHVPLEALLDLTQTLTRMATQSNPEELLPEPRDFKERVLDRYEGRPFLADPGKNRMVRFGLPGIDDKLISGPGSLGIIAAKTSAGKTSLAIQAMIHTLEAGRRSLTFSLEMSHDEIASRWVANLCGLDSQRVMMGQAGDAKAVDERDPTFLRALTMASQTLAVSDGTCTSFDGIAKVIRKQVKESQIEVVFIDYFTLVNPPELHNKSANTAFILGQMSKGFKALAKELSIAIVVLSQFNRDVDDGEEPHLKHLRETGQLEQDANWVLLMWTNKKTYEPDENRDIWVKLEKNRGGSRYVRAYVEFNPATGRFEQIERNTAEVKISNGARQPSMWK